MVGTLACLLVVVPPGESGNAAHGLRRMLGTALAWLTLASVGMLLARTLEMNGGAWNQVPADLPTVVGVTHFGHIWRWRIPALLVAWGVWAWAARSPRHARAAGWAMMIAAAVIALTRSDTGHPADHGDFTPAVWIDAVHMLAAATWVGSLFGMAWVVFPALLKHSEGVAIGAARTFRRLSSLSGIALGVVIACGVFNAWQQLGPLSSLWRSGYGITLDVKLALVAVMIGIGAHNRYVKLPALLRAAGDTPRASAIGSLLAGWSRRFGAARDARAVVRSCARAVAIEALLGLGVIGATATLIHSMPPADMQSMPAMQQPMADGAARPMVPPASAA